MGEALAEAFGDIFAFMLVAAPSIAPMKPIFYFPKSTPESSNEPLYFATFSSIYPVGAGTIDPPKGAS